jgi:tetratricopeptide (TPR) repeat protein
MFRFTPVRVAQLLLLLAPTLCIAQTGMTHVTSAQLLVRVVFQDERAAGNQIRVELLNDSEVPVGTTFTDSEGRATFHISIPGQYTVRVSGIPIQGTSSETIRIEEMDKSRSVFVHVKPRTDASSTTTKSNAPQVTSAAELRIPSDARKAFHKGMEAWEHNDFPKAAEQFEKAVAIYPEYDTAFNNLGVMYYQMVEPLNPVSLTLICVADIQTGDDDGALLNAHKVHQLPHEGYAVVHYAAGQALEHKGQPEAATAEYETYLQESPNGAEASQVKSALARLTATNRLSPQ